MPTLLSEMKELLEEAGIESSEAEVYWLLEAATGRSRVELAAGGYEVSEVTRRRALKLAARRAAGEPLQYLVGMAGFRRLELAVGPGVFIPRPETELVAERAMQLLPTGGTAVDVGTGCGAIALAIADERPDARVYGTELSAEAFAWAKRNRDRLALDVELVHCDLFEALPDALRERVDVVVSNPPYVATDEVGLLSTEVRDHEPHKALFAGVEGLVVLERVAAQARAWLRRGGWIVLEIAEPQASKVTDLLERLGYTGVFVFTDLAGRNRIAQASLST